MIHHTSIVVRYAETDQMGIVHHAVYPVWYEVARTELIRQIGIPYSQMEAMGVMTPLVELKSRYKGVTRYEDRAHSPLVDFQTLSCQCGIHL